MPASASATTPATHAQIRAHIERNMGRIVDEFTGDHSSRAAAVSVLRIEPGEKRPFHTLITLGLSDRAMPVPALEADAPRHIELMFTLPENWKFDRESQRTAQWHWPVTELLRLASLPGGDQWLGWGHVIPNGDPLKPYAPDTELCAVILAPSLLVKQEFYELDTGDRRIVFLGAIPLYKEEYALQQREGMKVLLAKLIDRSIKDVVHPKRRNVMKKRFGLF